MTDIKDLFAASDNPVLGIDPIRGGVTKPPKLPPHTGTNAGSNIISQVTNTIKQHPLIFIGILIAGVLVLKR